MRFFFKESLVITPISLLNINFCKVKLINILSLWSCHFQYQNHINSINSIYSNDHKYKGINYFQFYEWKFYDHETYLRLLGYIYLRYSHTCLCMYIMYHEVAWTTFAVIHGSMKRVCSLLQHQAEERRTMLPTDPGWRIHWWRESINELPWSEPQESWASVQPHHSYCSARDIVLGQSTLSAVSFAALQMHNMPSLPLRLAMAIKGANTLSYAQISWGSCASGA